MRKTNPISVTGVTLAVLSLLFVAGALTVFAPCAAAEDGTAMHCHNVGRWLTWLGVGLMAVAGGRLGLTRRMGLRAGLDAAGLVLCVLTALAPGTLAELCMTPEMRCRALTAPFALAMAVLIGAVTVADLALALRKRGNA